MGGDPWWKMGWIKSNINIDNPFGSSWKHQCLNFRLWRLKVVVDEVAQHMQEEYFFKQQPLDEEMIWDSDEWI